jgi:flavin reductase (DIM6/NTAB) family NADH-FMN oxidoreductase RutF
MTPLPDQTRFRETLGRFATGVTVITTASDERIHGMTANGFMSVSLEPLLVVVSVAQQTKMHDFLLGSGHYGVSILGRTHESLSDHFAGRPMDGVDVPFLTIAGVPVLDGALAYVAAKVVDAHPAGDHTLFVGEVVACDSVEGPPLIFHSGGYRELGEVQSAHGFSGTWSDFCLEPVNPVEDELR